VVDAELRSIFPEPEPLGRLQDDQKQLVERCLGLEANVNSATQPRNSIKAPPLVDLWVQHAPASAGGRNVAAGKGTCVIDVPALEVAAWCVRRATPRAQAQQRET
jgi:hypothetical protein